MAGVIVLAVVLIAGIVALMNSIPLSIKTIYNASRFYAGITPRGDATLTPKLAAILKKDTPVPIEKMLYLRVSEVQARSIVGPWPFVVAAYKPDDLKYVLSKIPNDGIDGRLPKPGQAEAIISEPLARNIKKKLGDTLLKPDDPKAYSPNEVKIVGIIKSKFWVAYADYDYYSLYHFPPIDLLTVWTGSVEDQDKFSPWAYDHLKGDNARVYGHFLLERETKEMFEILYKILNLVIFILVMVITIMMGMLINIYQSQRIPEFGLLQALGYSKSTLLKRVLTETFIVVVGGWLLGLLAAYGMLSTIDAVLMHPNSFMLDTLDQTAYLYTIPVPIAILVVAVLTQVKSFQKFDPIGVVERRLI